MPTATVERKAAGKAAPPLPSEPEHVPCPRCDSTNTKFCYYNNYNFSQPRHFCKSCRRYWTHGGTLRDIPIGGGSRKGAKRPRAAVASAAAVFPNHDYRMELSSVVAPSQGLLPMGGGPAVFSGEGKMNGSFTSLLNHHHSGGGILGLSGFGFEDVGFGLGRNVWPFYGVVEGGAAGGGDAGQPWHLQNGDGGGVLMGGGDCIVFPDLAISTLGMGTLLK